MRSQIDLSSFCRKLLSLNLSEAELKEPLQIILTQKEIRIAPLLSQVFQLRRHRRVTEIEAIGADIKKVSHLSKETLAKLSLRIEINVSVETQSFLEKYCQK